MTMKMTIPLSSRYHIAAVIFNIMSYIVVIELSEL